MIQATKSVSRRRLFASASSLGAIAAAASLLPAVESPVPSTPAARDLPAKGGGYTLSEHVKRYYKSALV